MECLVDIDMFNKYPTSAHEWECLKTTRRISYRVKEMKDGAFFGIDEIREGVPRKSTVYAVHEAELFYVNRD